MKYIFFFLFQCLVYATAYGQSFAVKTNLLSAANGALNGGIEYAFSSKSSFDLSGSIRPWERSELSVNRYWMVQPEYRYWVCQKFNGSFWGVFLNGAQFNVGGKKMPFGLLPELKEHRYAGWMVGGGVSYGYQLMLNHHWNIEASIGVGYEYIDYKKYRCPAVCAELEKVGRHHYFGPNKVSIGIVYIFN